MVSISEAASVTFHGIILIAGSDTLLMGKKIADRSLTSRHHIQKVLQRLVRIVLKTERGSRRIQAEICVRLSSSLFPLSPVL